MGRMSIKRRKVMKTSKLYKLTDENGRTYNNTQWGENVTHSGTGQGDLCSEGWIHAYTSPLLAIFLNPIHASFSDPILWESEGNIEKEDHGLKVGCRSLTTIRKIALPAVTTKQQITFAILCAKEVYKNKDWNVWANNWLNNKDRSRAAAYDAAAAAAYADSAAYAAADDADSAAYAAYAAYAAAAYAYAAYAAYADADDAAYAAYADDAAYAAYADAAEAAARAAASGPLDLHAIAMKAMQN
jgi:hypothetical protein